VTEPGQRRDLVQAMWAYAVVAALVAGFVRIDVEVPAVGHLGSALVAVLLLYAPVFFAWRRDEDLTTYGFCLAPVFGIHPRICSRSIDKGKNRAPELRGDLHGAKRLSIALGFGHPEVSIDFELRVATFLMSENHNGPSSKPAHAGYDGRVIGVPPVAMNLHEVLEKEIDVVQKVRTLRMSGHQDLLHRRQAGVNLLALLVQFFLQTGDLRGLLRVIRVTRKCLDFFL
jgi:hypothetical protein